MATLNTQRLATSALARFGEPALYLIGGTERPVSCIISTKTEPVLSGGQLVFDEDHFSCQFAFPTTPEVGARLVCAGTEYRIDAPPSRLGGLWKTVLRRLVWPGSGSPGAPDVVSERYLTAAERAAYQARLAALEGNQLPAGQPGDILICDAARVWIASDTLPVGDGAGAYPGGQGGLPTGNPGDILICGPDGVWIASDTLPVGDGAGAYPGGQGGLPTGNPGDILICGPDGVWIASPSLPVDSAEV